MDPRPTLSRIAGSAVSVKQVHSARGHIHHTHAQSQRAQTIGLHAADGSIRSCRGGDPLQVRDAADAAEKGCSAAAAAGAGARCLSVRRLGRSVFAVSGRAALPGSARHHGPTERPTPGIFSLAERERDGEPAARSPGSVYNMRRQLQLLGRSGCYLASLLYLVAVGG